MGRKLDNLATDRESTIGRPAERSPWPVALVTVIAALVAAWVDARFGGAFSLRALLIPPVIVAAWFLGWRVALLLSLGTTLLWFLTIPQPTPPETHWTQTVWEAATRFGLLATVALLGSWLRVSVQRERRLARLDLLTDLANRKSFLERAEAERSRSIRSSRPVTLVYIDCDGFKSVNDTRGHLTGDEVLKSVAHVLRSTTRGYDVAARMGGDEFALLLPETGAEAARTVAERVRGQLREEMERHGWPVTFSLGVATFLESIPPVTEMVRAADERMYDAKRADGDTVRFATPIVSPPVD